MNDTIIENLKKANLFKDNNCYFMASELKIPNEYVLYVPLFNKNNDDDIYTYIINYTNEGIGILPSVNVKDFINMINK